MESWPTSEMLRLLWAGGLAAIPLALVVELVCRVRAVRPATRHALWAAVLASFVAPATVVLSVDLARPIVEPVGHALTRAVSTGRAVVATAIATAVGTSLQVVSAADERLAGRDQPGPGPLGSPEHAARDTEACARRSDAIIVPLRPPLRDTLSQGPSQPSCPSPGQGEVTAPAPSVTFIPSLLTDDMIAFAHLVALRDDMAEATSPIVNALPGTPSTSSLMPPVAPAAPKRTKLAESSNTAPVAAGRLEQLAAVRDAVAQISPIPSAVWLGGIALLCMVRVARTIAVRRVVGRARPAPQRVVRIVEALSREIGLRSAPQALITSERVSPMVWCGLRPRLVVPTELWATLDNASRCAVVAHELAHLRRRDHLLCWCEWLVGTLFWWHPVAWWARKRLHDEAEASCDAWVVALLPSARRAFAEALLVTKSWLFSSTHSSFTAGATRAALARVAGDGPALGVVSVEVLPGRTRKLARRITMVMTQRTAPKMSILGAVLALAVVGVGVVVTPTIACPPEEQESQARSAAKATVRVAPKAKRPSAVAGQEFFGEAQALDAMRKRELEAAAAAQGGGARSRSTMIAPTPPAPPVPPELPAPPSPPGMRGFVVMPAPSPMATADGPADGTDPRPYFLPQGKLEALAELMARNDVPVWIERHGDHIVVYATPQGHEVFAAFVALIHPEGQGDTPRPDNAPRRLRNPGAAAGQPAPSQSSSFPRMTPPAMFPAQRGGMGGGGGRGGMGGGGAGGKGGAGGMSMLPNQDQLQREFEMLARDRAALEAEAERVRGRAQQSEDRAELLTSLAEMIDAKAGETDDAAGWEALAQARHTLLGHGDALRSEAGRLEREFAMLEERMAQMERMLEELEAHLERAAAAMAGLSDVDDPDGVANGDADDDDEDDDEEDDDEDDDESDANDTKADDCRQAASAARP